MMLDRWRSNPISFIETVLYDPETKRPFKLLPAERAFLEHAFKLDDSGHLLYPEQLYSCPKKSGKTTFAGIHALATLLLFGGSYPEATICANDQEQSVGRVFTMIRRIIESSPLLKREAKITQDRITFPAFDVTITAIPSNFATAAGGNQNISVFDELWAFTSERSRRLWDELVPPPDPPDRMPLDDDVRRLRGQVVVVAGPVPARAAAATDRRRSPCWRWHLDVLEPLSGRAMARRAVAGGDAPDAAAERLSASCPQRVRVGRIAIRRHGGMGPMRAAVAHAHLGTAPDLRRCRCQSTKRDSTALVAVTFDKKAQVVRLVQHRVFTPAPGDPINFEATVEATSSIGDSASSCAKFYSIRSRWRRCRSALQRRTCRSKNIRRASPT